MIMWFLTLFMWCTTLIDLHMLNHPCELGKNSTQLWGIFCMCCWIQFANILLRIFASVFIEDTGLIFLVATLLGFGVGVIVT